MESLYIVSKLQDKFHDFLFLQVALVYPNNDPISFSCGFYGCLLAGVVPVPVEVPSSRRVRIGYGPQKICFLLCTKCTDPLFVGVACDSAQYMISFYRYSLNYTSRILEFEHW